MKRGNVVEVKNATVRFNMATERIDNLKEYFIKMIKRDLMFQEHLALKNVSLEVKKGESLGLIGNNGAGKSTLLKMICKVLKPYRGSVETKGLISPMIELGAGFNGDILIVDEVLSVGDRNFQNKCVNRMDELLKGGTTLLFVSHNMNMIKKMCKNVIWLESGDIVMNGPAEEVVAEYIRVQDERRK